MGNLRRFSPALSDQRRRRDEPSTIGSAELEEAREFCLKLYQLAPVGYVTHDAGGRILEANYTAGVMLGVPADRLRGENIKRFVAREDASSFAAHLSRVTFDEARCNLELRMQRPSGARFFAALESVPIDRGDGAGHSILTSLLDVTVNRQLQAHLLERQATCEAILGATSDALVGVDEQGAIRTFNPAAERIFGHATNEVLGRHVGALFDVAAPPMRSLEGQAETRSTRGVRSDGTTFDAEVRVSRVAGASYTMLSVVDVSHRRVTAAAVANAQRLELAGRLASSIAHDANNLLMSIASTASRIGDVVDDETAIRERVAELRRAALGGAAIVRRLTRMMGTSPTQPIEVELDAALESVSSALRPMLPEDVELVLELAASGSTVSLYPGRLEQLVFNLVVNAHQAMPEGGSVIIATARLLSPPRVRLTIEDTGIGMDAPTRARLFDPFFTTKKGGTGVGLATVRTIVEQARGTIAVESEQGAGTRFVVELPEIQRAEEAPVPIPRANRASLLLVESDTLVRSTLRAYLERGGHTVIEAADPHEALERARIETHVDAMLTARSFADGPGGSELPARVREMHPRAAVLYVCDPVQAHLVRRGQLAPDTFLLTYPCSERELAEALVAMLGPAPSEDAGQLHVLLVEDDALNRRMLGELLRKRGYAVQLAATIEQALAHHRAGPPASDVVVADAHLPDGTLLDLVAGVRAGDTDPAVVVMSGLGPREDPDIAAALAQPRTAFVRKPCAVEDITACIRQVGVHAARASGMTRG